MGRGRLALGLGLALVCGSPGCGEDSDDRGSVVDAGKTDAKAGATGSDGPLGGAGGLPSGGGSGGSIVSGGSGGSGGSAGSGGSGASGGADGSAGTGASGGSSGSGGSCASVPVASKLIATNLLFVVDRSATMNCNPPSSGQSSASCEAFPVAQNPSLPTKWAIARDALKGAIAGLQASSDVRVGMVAFPISTSDCGVATALDVPIKPLDTTQIAALDAFLNGVVPKGKTPIVGATVTAYSHLFDELKAGTLSGNLSMVVLYDGYESCNVASIPQFVADPNGDVWNAFNLLGIRTFVVGVPGSENARALLSQIAWIGATPRTPTCTHTPVPNDVGDCHFDLTVSSNLSVDLNDALTTINNRATTCELEVPSPPAGKQIDYTAVSVENAGITIAKDLSKPCDQGANGWQFNAAKTRIVLCGNACTEAKKPGASLVIALGCLIDVT